MKDLVKILGAALFCFIALSCNNVSTESEIKEDSEDVLDFVNTFAGTETQAHSFVGAALPFGRIQLGPDTRKSGKQGRYGYYYSDTTLLGFTHNHQCRSGGNPIGDILFLPYTTKTVSNKTELFSHSNEVNRPGYYSVQLDNSGIKCELTATEYSGHHRIEYPSINGGLRLRFGHFSDDIKENVHTSVKIVNDRIIEGYFSRGTNILVPYKWFRIVFNEPFEFEKDNLPLENLLKPYQINAEVIELRLTFGLFNTDLAVDVSESFVDEEGPRINLAESKKIGSFDSIATYAEEQWKQALSTLHIETIVNETKVNVYTAMYFLHLSPSLLCDADGRFKNERRAGKQVPDFTPYYNFGLSDTYRTWFSVMSLLHPEKYNDWVSSIFHSEIAVDYNKNLKNSTSKIAYQGLPVAADALSKQLLTSNASDLKILLEKAKTRALAGVCGDNSCVKAPYSNESGEKNTFKETLGYVPGNKCEGSVPMGLEMSYFDWSLAKMFEYTDQKEQAKDWFRKGQYYRHYFNPRSKLMSAKDDNGEWSSASSTHNSNIASDFDGGNPYQWSTFVPHDIVGLRELVGGKKDMGEWLDTLFFRQDANEPHSLGLIGMYNHEDKTNQHIPYLYNYTDRSYRTSEILDSILDNCYTASPAGIIGADYHGQMSAWYILSALGFYQICPGEPTYDLGRPLIDEAKIKVGDGWFTIKVENNSSINKYIQKVILNDQELKNASFHHDSIKANGSLLIYLGASI